MSVELILLKGHLFLEVIIDQALDYHLLVKNNQRRNLSFHKKLLELEKCVQNPNSYFLITIIHIKTLNSLRNRLAHEPFFTDGKLELEKWSQQVLLDIPITKFSKYTYRTKIIHCMASLARSLLEQPIPYDPKMNTLPGQSGP